MSVAFRRESDEEHKEPRFERPIPPGPNLVTSRGLAEIRAHVAEIEATAPEAGSEAARDLRYWRARLATARLMAAPDASEVAFGTRVSITLGGSARTIDIVGDDEADPSRDRLAFSAPLARALIGAVPGERIDFGGRPEAIEVLSIEAIADSSAPLPTP